jgi:hypothetical protein
MRSRRARLAPVQIFVDGSDTGIFGDGIVGKSAGTFPG